jgi:hypothetical protein
MTLVFTSAAAGGTERMTHSKCMLDVDRRRRRTPGLPAQPAAIQPNNDKLSNNAMIVGIPYIYFVVIYFVVARKACHWQYPIRVGLP